MSEMPFDFNATFNQIMTDDLIAERVAQQRDVWSEWAAVPGADLVMALELMANAIPNIQTLLMDARGDRGYLMRMERLIRRAEAINMATTAIACLQHVLVNLEPVGDDE